MSSFFNLLPGSFRRPRAFVFGAALLAGVSATRPLCAESPAAKSPARAPTLPIGIGVGAPLDFEEDITFADAIKVARVMEPAPGVTADEDGWLRGDGAILVWARGKDNNTAGAYKLQYDGRAKVFVDLCEATISEEVYDPKTDTSTRDIKLATDQDPFKLRFEQATRGVRHVKLMRPIARGASVAHGLNELWYRPMKQVHQRFAWIRTMDFTATNGQNVVHWKDRTLPSRWSQYWPAEGSWWQGRGAAWEYVVHMANEEQKDLWINVPAVANDEYVRNLARLIKYGSDGKNPYTKPQAKPVWAPLDPKLKLYVEYSNEVWNFGFPTWTQLLELSRAEVARGNTNLNFDGSTFDGDWNSRYWFRRIVQISTIFREEFGDDQMMSRIRPLFETQLGWADNYLWHGLWFLDAWYNNGDGQKHVATPHPVHYYIWGTGGSTYPGFPQKLGESKTLTVNQMFEGYRSHFGEWVDAQRRDIDYARAFGLKRVSYEGGPGMDAKGGDEYKRADDAKHAAQTDPRIQGIYSEMLKRYAEVGGDGWTNFLTTHPAHGIGARYDGKSLLTPKARAIQQFQSKPVPRPTWGVLLPATISAGRFRVARKGGTGEHDEAVHVDPAAWYGYTVRNTKREAFAVRVTASAGDSDGTLNLWVDGERAGTFQIARGGKRDTAPITVTLEPGQHGIRLDGDRGEFDVVQLKIERAVSRR